MAFDTQGVFRRTKKTSEICHKFMSSLARFLGQKSTQEKASKREVKSHKSAKEKPTNTWQIKFLMDWSLNLSQIIKPFPPSNLGQIFIWDVFFVWRNAPLGLWLQKYFFTLLNQKPIKASLMSWSKLKYHNNVLKM